MRAIIAIGAGLLIAASSQLAHANIIQNGSFESGLTDWTATGSVRAAVQGNSTDGTHVAVFSYGDNPNDGVLSQTVTTTVADGYTLSFDFGAYSIQYPGQLQRMRVQVIGGSTLLDMTVSAIGSSPTIFPSFSSTFVADATNITVKFSDASGTTTSIDGLLDNVQLVQLAGTPVPEPASLSLLAIGGVALLTKRRRAARARV